MPALTARRAICLSGLVACAIYATAPRNQWALDDHGLIERNPAAHSIPAALRAAFSPYWPPEGDYSAGLYRPITTLTYAIDWTISGGRPFWFHLTNLLLHGLATALAVGVVLRWLPPAGGLAAGVVMAVHPVRVEAVANIAGRAEILVAVGLLAAVLAARRYRRAALGGQRVAWLAATLLSLGFALGSKEHAAVGVFVLALDQALEEPGVRRAGWTLYPAVTALTIGWFFLWRAVAGQFVQGGVAVQLQDLPLAGRLATTVPVQLEVIRLLVWPFRLAADYSPQTVPVRDSWTAFASLALVATTAVLGLALALWRRAPALTFGILAGAATYLPTSNLLFTSGVVLAERVLYFAALVPAVAGGWLLARSWDTPRRRVVAGALAVVCVAFAGRLVTRIPFWRDSRSVILQGFLEHPENFSNRVRLADALLQTGDTAQALAQYLVAGELFHDYSFVPVRAGQLAFAMGRTAFALDLGRRARAITPGHPTTARFLADVFLSLGQPDSALAVARDAVTRSPGNLSAARNYWAILQRTRAPAWVRDLAGARLDWLEGRLASASTGIASSWTAGGIELPDHGPCWDLLQSLPMLRMLAPTEAESVATSLAARQARPECRAAGVKVAR